MKHVFYIHSHLTFYCSQNVQKHLAIGPEEVRYILARNYSNAFHSDIKAVDFSELQDKYNTIMNPKELKENLKIVDNKIEHLTDDLNYVLYTSTLSHPLKQIVATHPNCKSVEIIEEGISSYMNEPSFYASFDNQFSFLRHFWLEIVKPFFGYPLRISGMSPFNTNRFTNHHYFGFYEGVYPYANKKKIRLLPDIRIENIPTEFKLKGEKVLFFDAVMVEQKKICTPAEYLRNFDQCITMLDVTGKRLFAKFHPSQDQEIIESIKAQFKKSNCEVILIPDEIPAEQILTQSTDLKVFGWFSTLLFYAFKMGHETISFANTFMEYMEVQTLISTYPDDFKKKILLKK